MPKKKGHSSLPTSLSLPVETGLDQPVRRPFASKVLDEVAQTIRYAKRENSLDLALSFAEKLDGALNLSGKGLAWALYQIQKEFFPEDQEGFLETIFSRLGKAPDTIKRYLKAGDTIAYLNAECSADVRNLWLDRPVQDLIALAQARAEHGNFTARQIATLAKATDNSDLRKNIRALTGKEETESTAIMLELRKDGTLVAYQADKRVEIGYLGSKDPIGKRAIARIIGRSHIKDKSDV